MKRNLKIWKYSSASNVKSAFDWSGKRFGVINLSVLKRWKYLMCITFDLQFRFSFTWKLELVSSENFSERKTSHVNECNGEVYIRRFLVLLLLFYTMYFWGKEALGADAIYPSSDKPLYSRTAKCQGWSSQIVVTTWLFEFNIFDLEVKNQIVSHNTKHHKSWENLIVIRAFHKTKNRKLEERESQSQVFRSKDLKKRREVLKI